MYSSHTRYQEMGDASELVPIFRYAYPAPGLPDLNEAFEKHRKTYQNSRAARISELENEQSRSMPLTAHQNTEEGHVSLAMLQKTRSITYKVILCSIMQPASAKTAYNTPVLPSNSRSTFQFLDYHIPDTTSMEYLQYHDRSKYVWGISRGFTCDPNSASLKSICEELKKFVFPTGRSTFAGITDIRSLHYGFESSSGVLIPGVRISAAHQDHNTTMHIVGADTSDWAYREISIAIALPGLGFPNGVTRLKVGKMTRAQALRKICHTVDEHLDGLRRANEIATSFKLPHFEDDSDEWKILRNLGGLYIFSLIHMFDNIYVLDIGLKCPRLDL